jgi:hypothetical protein
LLDSRRAALVESVNVVMWISDGRFTPNQIAAELGELLSGAIGRRNDARVTIFKTLVLRARTRRLPIWPLDAEPSPTELAL